MTLTYQPNIPLQAGQLVSVSDPSDAVTPTKAVSVPAFMPVDATGAVIGGSGAVSTVKIDQTTNGNTNGVALVGSTGSAVSTSGPADGSANPGAGGVLNDRSFNQVYNGATWDRQRGDVNGTWTISKGGATLATGQVAVTTSATLVVAARAARQKVTLTPTSSVVYYVGNTGVTTGTGAYVPAGASITLDTAAAIYAVGASAVTMSYIEFF